MPARLTIARCFPGLVARQDSVITTSQAAAVGFTRGAIHHVVVTGRWQRILPGVLLLHGQDPTRRQLLYAARAWAGPDALVDGASACRWYGLRSTDHEPGVVHLVVPYTASARSRDFVRVRRSRQLLAGDSSELLSYVDAASAVVVAARGMVSERAIARLASESLQRGLVTVDDLDAAHVNAPPKNSRRFDRVLADLAAGVRSAAELDTRRLVARSRLLPSPVWNCWLDLGDGGPFVSPDALWEEAATIHETNGRRYHAWVLAFDDLQARHDRLTAAGFAVLHNSPGQIRAEPGVVLQQIESTYRRRIGLGLPDGVTIVRRSAVGSPSSAGCAG